MSIRPGKRLNKMEILIVAFILLCFSVPIGLLEIEYEQIAIGVAIILVGVCSVVAFLILNQHGMFWKLLEKEKKAKQK